MENMQATNVGAIIRDSEHVEIGYAAGGDMYITETHYHESSDGFTDINTSVYSSQYYTPPVFTLPLIEHLKEKKLLIISGGTGFDKNEFARHVAFCICSDIPGINAREWRDSEEFENLLKEIREEETPTLFILPNAIPQSINYDVAQLAVIARQHRHHVLLTTEMTTAAWQQSASILKLYWFEVPASGLFSPSAVLHYVENKLKDYGSLFGISPGTSPLGQTVLAENITGKKLAEHFETPNQADFFFTLLEANTTNDPLEKKIRDSLFTVKDKSETIITKWYRSLPPTDRLIALGAALLDGLFDDQFFAVMQHVVNDFWHYRDKKLQSLDYCDLDFLMNFFTFEMFGDGRQTLVCKFPNQRAEIIRAAWQAHKRHILSAFSIITTLAGSSSAGASRRITDAEINGTRERGKRLRAVAAETISDVGIVSLQTAEPKLIELAAASDITTRRITAKAVARWRAFDKDEQMYAALHRWKQSHTANVRSTVVFTLQYAAEYDSPGQLDRRIIELLSEMSGDSAAVSSILDLLPKLITSHAQVIKDDLMEHFAIHSQYSDLLSAGFVELYGENPMLLKELLERWLEKCLDEASVDNRRSAFTYRDNQLILILKTYRMLPYTGGADVISLAYVWGLLDHLHVQEQRSTMRAFILETAAYLIGAQPEEAVRHIEPIFRKLGTEDRLSLIRAIGWIYLHQRTQFAEGHCHIHVHNFAIPVSNTTRRPATEIETILYRWLTGVNAFAREVAALAFVEFATLLDYDEPVLTQTAINTAMQQKQEEIQMRVKRDQQRPGKPQVQFPFMPELSLWTRIKIFFWLLFRSPEEKALMRELMSTLLMYKKTNPAYLNTLIRRWTVHNSERVRSLGWWVGKLVRM